MGIRDLFTRKASRIPTQSSRVVNSVLTRTNDNYTSLAKEGYIMNAYVRRSVDLIANAVSGIPLVVKEEDGTPAPDSELQKLLDIYGGSFTARAFAYLMLSGNNYIEVVKTSVPVELFLIRPDLVKKQPDGSFQYTNGQQKIRFEPDEMIHSFLFNPLSDLEGVSPIAAARRSIDAHNSANDFNTSLMQNNATPSGILTVDGYLDDSDYDRLKKEMREGWSGAGNAGLPKLLDNGLKWQSISQSPQELNWLEGKRDAAVEIAAAFGVPSELIGMGQTTYSNRKEAVVSFYSETVKPLLESFTYDLSNQLAPQFGEGQYVDADYSTVPALQENEDTRIKKVEALKGVLTINELRSLYGFDSITGGDIILVPQDEE